MKRKMHALSAAVATVAPMLFVGTNTRAAVVDWSSTAVDTNWTNGANWIGGVAPANDFTTDIARFDQTSYFAQPIPSNNVISGVQFGDGTTLTSPITLGLNNQGVMYVGTNGITMYANAGAVSLPGSFNSIIGLGGTQTWTNNSLNPLTVSATIFNNNNTPMTLTFAGSGAGGISLQGGYGNEGILESFQNNNPVPAKAVSVVVDMTGSGGLTLNNAGNYFSGGLTVLAGTITTQNEYNGVANNNVVGGIGTGTITLGDTSGSQNAGIVVAGNNYLNPRYIVPFDNNIVLNSGNNGTVTLGASVSQYNEPVTANFTGTIAGTHALTIGSGTAQGTVVLSGADTGYTGSFSVVGGSLQVNGSTGTAGVTMAGGNLFNYSPAGGGGTQAMGPLTFSVDDSTVQSTSNGGSTSLSFSSLTRNTGATGNFVLASSNGGISSIMISGRTTGFIDEGTYFNGGTSSATYAYYDSTAGVRAINYGVDPNTVSVTGGPATIGTVNSSAPYSNVLVDNSGVTGQTTATISTLQLGTGNFALASGAILTVNGILKAGNTGGGTLSGDSTTGIQPGSDADLIVRTDMASDSLTINAPLVANGTNALVKSGAGKLTLNGTNGLTGGLFLNGGTLAVSSESSLGTAGAAITFNGGTLLVPSNFTIDPTRPLVVNSGGGTLTAGGGTQIIANTLSGTGTLNLPYINYGNVHYVFTANNSAFSGSLIANNRSTLELDGPNSGGSGQIAFSTYDGDNDPAILQLRNDNSATFLPSSFYAGDYHNDTINVDRLTSNGSGGTLTLKSFIAPQGNNTYNITGADGYNLGIATLNIPLNQQITLNPTSANVAIGNAVGVPGNSPQLNLSGSATGNTIHAIDLTGASGSPSVIVKSGTWNITGSGSYVSGTNISGGTLIVSNTTGSATGTGTVIIGPMATLASGTVGTIYGAVNSSGGATIAPGGSGFGTLTVGSLSTATGDTLQFNVGAPVTAAGNYSGSVIDFTKSAGLSLASGTILDITDVPTTPGDYRLFGGTFGSPNLMNLTNVPTGSGLSYSVQSPPSDPNYIDLVVVASGLSTLTWNDTGGSPADGTTWAANNANQNWNNGNEPTTYNDSSNGSNGDIVIFSNIPGGSTSSYSVTVTGAVHPSSTTFTNTTGNNYNIGGSGTIAGTGTLTVNGTGTVTLSSSNTYTGGTIVNAGELILASATAFPANTALNISSGATVQVFNHSGSSSYVPTLSSLSNSGTIDITNNAMIVHNGNVGTINAQVAEAFNNGAWNGTNTSSGVITSSAAAGDTNHLTAVGVATGLTTFQGAAVAGTDVLVKYTYYGDANLDGSVTSTDYTLIDAGYLSQSGSNKLTGWQNGDFNYDGVINGSDYTLIDNAFNTQGAAIQSEVASATAQIAGGGSSAVPEPTSLGLIGIGAIRLLRRRTSRGNACA